MNDEREPELRARFAQQREAEHKSAPIWNPRWLEAPRPRRTPVVRWAFATLVVVCSALALFHQPQGRLADLPPLFDQPHGPLFADLSPSSSDFLLPTHLILHIP